jgi:hypothetical protein
MKITHTMFVMFMSSFLIQYFLMSPIMVSTNADITNNIGKAYMATIMGLSMVILEIMMHDYQYHTMSLNMYVFFGGLVALFVYLYRIQAAIKDKEYLKGMIEHHSMAVFTSQEILKKTDNYNVAKLAKNIIAQQKDELRVMQELVAKFE